MQKQGKCIMNTPMTFSFKYLRNILLSVDNISETLSWNLPTKFCKKWIAHHWYILYDIDSHISYNETQRFPRVLPMSLHEPQKSNFRCILKSSLFLLPKIHKTDIQNTWSDRYTLMTKKMSYEIFYIAFLRAEYRHLLPDRS